MRRGRFSITLGMISSLLSLVFAVNGYIRTTDSRYTESTLYTFAPNIEIFVGIFLLLIGILLIYYGRTISKNHARKSIKKSLN